MPFIETSTLTRSPFWQFNGHLETILSSFRKVVGVTYERERIDTPDGDFLDLDWVDNGGSKLVVLTHGLEGHSGRPYIMGMAKLLSLNGYDVLAWNCRSCSGELNKTFRFYNHGEIEDIDLVIKTALKRKNYDNIVLVGFSMGGNISLKYASVSQNPAISNVVAFSAPLDMRSSLDILDKASNWLYKTMFIKDLQPKMEMKSRLFPERVSIEYIKKKKDWMEMLKTYFCTFNGYTSMEDFFEKGSALNFIPDLKIPALIVQAQNDPFLTPPCFPIDLAKKHPFIHLETPQKGGHCAFMTPDNSEFSWAELRTMRFLTEGYYNKLA
jgi:uncharacterized protein